MNIKTRILDTFGRDGLKKIVDDIGLHGADHRNLVVVRKKLSLAQSMSAEGLFRDMQTDCIEDLFEIAGSSLVSNEGMHE